MSPVVLTTLLALQLAADLFPPDKGKLRGWTADGQLVTSSEGPEVQHEGIDVWNADTAVNLRSFNLGMLGCLEPGLKHNPTCVSQQKEIAALRAWVKAHPLASSVCSRQQPGGKALVEVSGDFKGGSWKGNTFHYQGKQRDLPPGTINVNRWQVGRYVVSVTEGAQKRVVASGLWAGPAGELWPCWSPDGKHLAVRWHVSSDEAGPYPRSIDEVVLARAAGLAPVQLQLEKDETYPGDLDQLLREHGLAITELTRSSKKPPALLLQYPPGEEKLAALLAGKLKGLARPLATGDSRTWVVHYPGLGSPVP